MKTYNENCREHHSFWSNLHIIWLSTDFFSSASYHPLSVHVTCAMVQFDTPYRSSKLIFRAVIHSAFWSIITSFYIYFSWRNISVYGSMRNREKPLNCFRVLNCMSIVSALHWMSGCPMSSLSSWIANMYPNSCKIMKLFFSQLRIELKWGDDQRSKNCRLCNRIGCGESGNYGTKCICGTCFTFKPKKDSPGRIWISKIEAFPGTMSLKYGMVTGSATDEKARTSE